MVCLAMGGLIWPKPDPGPMSYESALILKKKVARYMLLSWTMCLSSISKPLEDMIDTKEDYVRKGLLTEDEATLLKVKSALGYVPSSV